jgi:hypothetical protein
MMISTALIVSLLLTVQGGMQIMANRERQQFSQCLRAFLDAKREERMPSSAFETTIDTACANQATAYRAAYIAAAMRAGDSRTAAERDATLEVDDLRENYKGMYPEQ